MHAGRLLEVLRDARLEGRDEDSVRVLAELEEDMGALARTRDGIEDRIRAWSNLAAPTIFTLANRADAFNFHLGQPLSPPVSPRYRLMRSLADVLWNRPTMRVTAIDRERGTITVG